MRRKDDILWKVVIEEVFDDLLRFVYPDAEELYDLERGFVFLRCFRSLTFRMRNWRRVRIHLRSWYWLLRWR